MKQDRPTPESTERARKLALISKRQEAYGVDFLIWHASGWLFFRAIGFADLVQSAFRPDQAKWMPAFTLVAYRILFLAKDGMAGYSPGKYISDLRVVDRTTRLPIGPLQSIQRNMLLLIPFVGEFIILLQMSFGPRFFDGLANTEVIETEDTTEI